MDEYLEDYEFTFHYHPGKVNVVVDALRRKSWGVLASYGFSGMADARDCGIVRTTVQWSGSGYFGKFSGYAFPTK